MNHEDRVSHFTVSGSDGLSRRRQSLTTASVASPQIQSLDDNIERAGELLGPNARREVSSTARQQLHELIERYIGQGNFLDAGDQQTLELVLQQIDQVQQ